MTCPTCQGRGRVNAPGGVNPGEVTQRCNDCDSKGILKDKAPCPACDGSALGIGCALPSLMKATRTSAFTSTSPFRRTSCANTMEAPLTATGQATC